MPFIIDENLPGSLIGRLGDLWPGCTHVKLLGLQSASDTRIWEYAKKQGLTILTKDHDFQARATLLGSPPQVVWLRIGNCSIDELERLLRRNAQSIDTFALDANLAVLTLSP